MKNPFMWIIACIYLLAISCSDDPISLPKQEPTGNAINSMTFMLEDTYRGNMSGDYHLLKVKVGTGQEQPGSSDYMLDSVRLYCPCFSQADLESLRDVSWSWGWWSDVPGCKAAPYDQLLELWITNAGLPNDNYNFSAQAGTINGNAFASSAIFNHKTQQFDLLCGGYTTPEIAEPCAQILQNFIQSLHLTHPEWDYCERF